MPNNEKLDDYRLNIANKQVYLTQVRGIGTISDAMVHPYQARSKGFMDLISFYTKSNGESL